MTDDTRARIPRGTKASKMKLIRRMIDGSGLTIAKWAAEVPWRDERTVARWLAGDTEVPEVVRRPLLEMEAAGRYRR